MRYLVVAAVAAALALPATSSASNPTSLKRQIATLKATNTRLHDALHLARLQRDAARRSVAPINAEANKAHQLETDNARLTSENEGLRAGLPDAVTQVATDDLYRLLFFPIRDRPDVCGSFYSSGSYWSVTFSPPYADGTC